MCCGPETGGGSPGEQMVAAAVCTLAACMPLRPLGWRGCPCACALLRPCGAVMQAARDGCGAEREGHGKSGRPPAPATYLQQDHQPVASRSLLHRNPTLPTDGAGHTAPLPQSHGVGPFLIANVCGHGAGSLPGRGSSQKRCLAQGRTPLQPCGPPIGEWRGDHQPPVPGPWRPCQPGRLAHASCTSPPLCERIEERLRLLAARPAPTPFGTAPGLPGGRVDACILHPIGEGRLQRQCAK